MFQKLKERPDENQVMTWQSLLNKPKLESITKKKAKEKEEAKEQVKKQEKIKRCKCFEKSERRKEYY